mgnify:FL=1
MPSLSLSNTVSKAYNRVTTICIDTDFSSAPHTRAGNFTGVNTSACELDNDGTYYWLKVTSSATGGYATRSFPTTIGTTYNYAANFMSPSFSGTLKIGTAADDGTHINLSVSGGGMPGYGTRLGSFTATTTTTHISFVVSASGKTQKWGSLIISEDN